MAINYDLNNTGPEVQARLDQVFPNQEAISTEGQTRAEADAAMREEMRAYTDAEKDRAQEAETALADRATALEEQVGSGGSIDTRIADAVDAEAQRAQQAEASLLSLYEGMTQSDIVPGPLPETGEERTIYRVPGESSYADYMWNGSGFVKMAEYDNAIDNQASPGSGNLITSGGVYAEARKIVNSYTTSGTDLDVADESGNVLMRLANGHVKTKNFDSSKNALSEADVAKVAGIEEGAQANDVTTNDTESGDLEFSDEKGNVVMRLDNGHVKTKNFDSSKNSLSEADVAKVAGIEAEAEVNDVVTDDTEIADLTLSDEKKNMVAMFKDGHIITKNFDSAEDKFIREYLKGKKIVFIGDSLTDTRASEKPWYYLKFIEKTKCVPYNRGWSGSTIGNGYNSMCDRLDLPANDSQDRAANHLGFPTTADIVIFMGGTNDWARLKDQVYGDLLAPATKETFCGAVKYMMYGLKNRYPQSDIIILNLHHTYKAGRPSYSEITYEDDDETKTATISVNNSGKSKEDYRKAIKYCADMYGLPVVDMWNVGFSAIMSTDNQLYYVDGLHLSELGGEVMANYLIKQLKTILSKH